MMEPATIAALGARAAAMVRELGAVSAEPDRLVRLFLSPEHRRAADCVAAWMRAAGLEVTEDALGTMRGRLAGDDGNAPRLLIGSHIDTVIDAGQYDGPLGVIAGILAAEHVARQDRRPPFGIDVLAFGDEEGSRFPATFASSSAVAGVFDDAMLSLVDRDGVRFSGALAAYGKDVAGIPAAAYGAGDAAAYVELHIEQGPVLEAQGAPLGVVTGIIGQTRLEVVVTGEAGHAGTVPMRLRRDALQGMTELAIVLDVLAREHDDDGMVATIGKVEVKPGATNVIPGRVAFTVDLRSMTDAVRLAALQRFEAEAARVATARRLDIAVQRTLDTPTTACHPALQDALGAAIMALGHDAPRMPSGAGHDAMVMARLCPAAMMFVRCRGGISHNPAEHASEADMGLAIAALIGFIERFDPRAVKGATLDR